MLLTLLFWLLTYTAAHVAPLAAHIHCCSRCSAGCSHTLLLTLLGWLLTYTAAHVAWLGALTSSILHICYGNGFGFCIEQKRYKNRMCYVSSVICETELDLMGNFSD